MKDFLHHLFLFSQRAKFSSHSSTAKVLSRLCVLLNQYFRFNLNKNGQKIFYLNPSAKNNVGTLRLVAQLPQILKSTPFETVSSRTPQAPLRTGKKKSKTDDFIL